MLTTIAMTLALSAALPTAAVASSTPTPFNGRCEVGEFCLYYNSSAYGFGSLRDYPWSDGFLGDDRFVSPGAGQGQIVSANAAAYWNRSAGTVYVYTRQNFEGIQGSIGPGLGRRDFSLGYKNQVRSFFCSSCNWS